MQVKDLNWPVKISTTVHASAREVWQLISTPGNLEKFHPYCAKNPVKHWQEHNSKDEVHYYSGLIHEREFCKWIDGVGYDLVIGKRNGEKSKVSWRLEEICESECMISIEVRSAFLLRYFKVLRFFIHVFWLRPRLRQYLRAVTKGIKLRIESGQDVAKNQFGAHPWVRIAFTASRSLERPPTPASFFRWFHLGGLRRFLGNHRGFLCDGASTLSLAPQKGVLLHEVLNQLISCNKRVIRPRCC